MLRRTRILRTKVVVIVVLIRVIILLVLVLLLLMLLLIVLLLVHMMLLLHHMRWICVGNSTSPRLWIPKPHLSVMWMHCVVSVPVRIAWSWSIVGIHGMMIVRMRIGISCGSRMIRHSSIGVSMMVCSRVSWMVRRVSSRHRLRRSWCLLLLAIIVVVLLVEIVGTLWMLLIVVTVVILDRRWRAGIVRSSVHIRLLLLNHVRTDSTRIVRCIP